MNLKKGNTETRFLNVKKEPTFKERNLTSLLKGHASNIFFPVRVPGRWPRLNWLIWIVHRIFIERERTRKEQALQDFWIKIFKVFRYSFSETIPMFFNRLKGDFVPVRSLRNFSPVIDFELKFVKMRF